MPHAEDTRIVSYSPAQMFNLVSDVRRYPEFLPWCNALRVRSESLDDKGRRLLVTDMVARFKAFEERFTSRVTLDEAAMAIDVAYVDGPFKRLDNKWRFTQAAGQGCRIAFTIDFEFRSKLLQLLARTMFERALMKLSEAFVTRADEIYGPTAATCRTGSSRPQ